MKLMKSNYYALHVLRTAEPKLRKAIISNCNKDLVTSISECILNVLNGDVKLAGCNTRKLRKHKVTLRNLADKRVSLSTKKMLIVQRSGFLLPLLSADLPAIASLEIMLRKMYLVSAEKFSREARKKNSTSCFGPKTKVSTSSSVKEE